MLTRKCFGTEKLGWQSFCRAAAEPPSNIFKFACYDEKKIRRSQSLDMGSGLATAVEVERPVVAS